MSEVPATGPSPESAIQPKRSRLAMIVAASENDVIGIDGDLPWKLSADLKRFKKLTMGHAIIMGRKTYDSIGRLLPGRTTIVVTRNPDYRLEGAIVVHSLEAAIATCQDDETPFVVGGAEIYQLAMPLVELIYLTRVHLTIDGDTRLPAIDWSQWTRTFHESYEADEKNEAAFQFENYFRNPDPKDVSDKDVSDKDAFDKHISC